MILKNPNVQAVSQRIQQDFWVWDQALLLNFLMYSHRQLKLGPTLLLALHLSKHQDYGKSRALPLEILYLVGLV